MPSERIAFVFGKDTKESVIKKVVREAREQIKGYIETDNARRIPNLKA